ncbi:hypothetical protein IH979_00995 [Patescibacteria group bacterium]|nr:hypothetical protein [Patescibacteria group bacterium]
METVFFIDWLASKVLIESNLQKAAEVLRKAQKAVPELKAYETTPQGAPWHTEGAVVARHVERILAGLFAMVEGEQLLEIEEVARHKHLRREVQELQETIKEHAATLEAFALLHDIGKTVTVSFEAPQESKGAVEGFVQHRHRLHEQASETERQTYIKLVKAFHAQRPELREEELMARFFDEYEILTHFYEHASIGAGERFENAQDKICNMYRLSEKDRALLKFTIRYHLDVIQFFTNEPDVSKFLLLTARANKAGFDIDAALDFILAALFIDTAIGSLRYHEGVFEVDLRPTINFLLSEEMAAPERRRRRWFKLAQEKKSAFKALLAESDLAPEMIFMLMNIPDGPERGEVMQKVYELVQDQTLSIDFGAHTSEMAARINRARAAFDQNKHLVRE